MILTKKLLRRAAYAIAVLLLLIAGLVSIVSTEPARQYALAELSRRLAQQGIGLRAKSLDYRLFSLVVSLRDVEVYAIGKESEPFARAESLSVWLELGFGVPSISGVGIERPQVNLRFAKDGRSNLPELKPSQPGSKPLSFGEISFHEAAIRLSDAKTDTALFLPSVNAIVSEIGTQTYRVQVDGGAGGTIRYRDVSQSVLKTFASLDWRPAEVDIRRVLVETGDLKVSTSGTITNLETAALHVDASGAVAPLARLGGYPDRARGTYSASVDLRGLLTAPDIGGRVIVSGLAVDSYPPSEGTIEFQTAGQLSTVTVRSMQASWGLGSLDGSGELSLKGGENRIRARFRGISSDLLMKDPPVSGIARGNVDLRLQGWDAAAASGSAMIHVDPAKGKMPAGGDLQLRANGGDVALEVKSLQALGATVTGTVRVARDNSLSGTLALAVPDTKATATALRQERYMTSVVPVSGAAEAAIEIGGTVSNPTAAVTVDSNRLQIGPAMAGALHAELSSGKGAVTIRTLRYEAPESFGLRASGSVVGDTVDVRGSVRHRSVRELAAAAGTAAGSLPDGPIESSFQVYGTVNQPAVKANVASSGLTVLQQNLGTLRADIAYAGTTATVSNLTLDRGTGSIRGGGSWDTRTSRPTADLTIDSYPIDGLQLADGTAIRMVVNGKADTEGENSGLTVDARGIEIGPLKAAAASLRGTLAGEQANLDLEIPQWNTKTNLRFSLGAGMPAQFFGVFHGTPISAIYPEASGTVTAQVEGQLNLSDPVKTLRASADLSGAALRWKADTPELQLEQPAKITYDGQFVETTLLALRAGTDSKITLSGKAPLTGAGPAGTVQVDADLSLDTVAAAAGGIDPAEVHGRLRVNASMTGAGTKWDPSGEISIVDGEASHPSLPAPVSALNMKVLLGNQQIRIEKATAKWLQGDIALSGTAPVAMLFRQPGTFDLHASASKLKLDGLSEAAGRPIAGDASLEMDLSGSGFDPAKWDGKLTASQLRVVAGQAAFEQKAPLTVTLAKGNVTLDPFAIQGPESALTLSGKLSLAKPNPLSLQAKGTINAALTQLFTTSIRAEGDTVLDLSVTGTLAAPQLRGYLALQGIQGEIPAAQAVFEGLTGRVELAGQKVSMADGHGELNGGTFTAKGNAELDGTAVRTVSAEVHAKGTAWNVPAGLETAADIDLALKGTPQRWDTTGTIHILDGSYRESLVIERGLFRTFSAGSGVGPNLADASESPPIHLDIDITTDGPIVVANDLLNGEITAKLRVLGTVDEPGLVGRLDVNEGAAFYLGGRNYLIDRGAVTFTNQNKIEPTLDVVGRTRAGGYDIDLIARGTIGEKLDTSFTSNPPLPQADVISLLVSGRKLQDTRGSESQIAGDQALSYLSGNLGSLFSQRTNQALGVNLPRIDPGLIADEAEPTARLTLGQDFTDRLGLVYSVNLRNSSDQIWVGKFDITRRFQTRAVRQSDNSLRLQFQHYIEMGGVPPQEAEKKERHQSRVGTVEITVPDGSTEDETRLRKKLGLKTGKTFDFFALRKGVDRIKKTLREDGFPEATVRTRREDAGGTLNVSMTVTKGPKVAFHYEGSRVSRKDRTNVEKAWSQSAFDSLRIRQSSDVLRESLAKSGHYAAEVEAIVSPVKDGQKVVTLTVERGAKYDDVEIALPGSTMSGEALAKLFSTRKERVDAVLHPDRPAATLTQFYVDRGFLDAKVVPQPMRKQQDAVQVAFSVTEGTQVRVGRVNHTGPDALAGPIRRAIQLIPGNVYTPGSVNASRTRLEQFLAAEGRTGSEVKIEAARNGDSVDVTYHVDAAKQQILANVAVEGEQHVSANLVRSQIGLKPGEVITEAKLNTARRNLYATGAFSLADVEVRDSGSPGTNLLAKVREVRPYELRYGVLYDTERGMGGILDFSVRNILGSARTAGFRGRYDSRLQEMRTYFEQPSLLRLPLKLVNTGFVRRELNTSFITDRAGGSSYLEYRWRKAYLFNLGYRFEQVHTFEREPDPIFPFDIRLRIAPLTGGFARDTRDDLLDASRGSFTSHIVEWAPAALGGQLQYAKYFGQYFYYKPLREPTPVPWAGGLKSRLVYAGGVRYGIAQGLHGQDLVPSERFYGGGSNSVRGFAQDRLGPAAGSSPLGGESIFIANNELRFPFYKFIDGVAFTDAGAVTEKWRDFRFGDIRYTGGAGLRVRTPYFLIRVDYGLILDRRSGEPRGRLFFGIGQSF